MSTPNTNRSVLEHAALEGFPFEIAHAHGNNGRETIQNYDQLESALRRHTRTPLRIFVPKIEPAPAAPSDNSEEAVA